MLPARQEDRAGPRGEGLAFAYLAGRGYRLVERNFRTASGEIDLVVENDEALVFCEVKTRVGLAEPGTARAFEAIGPRKRARLRRLARAFLDQRPVGAARPYRELLRFDAIAVVLGPGGNAIALEHIENAFE